MKKHHIDRLEKLYAFLGTIKPKKFKFGSWAESPTGQTDVNVCGSTACALGWAASMPEFRKRGLKLQWEIYGWDHNMESEATVVMKNKAGFKIYGDDAGAEFFGLTAEEAEYLFIPKGLGWTEGMGPENMSLAQYRRGLRRFIDRKRKELGYK